MEKRVQILLGQEKRKLCGWMGALMGLFLLGFYLMFFGGGEGEGIVKIHIQV